MQFSCTNWINSVKTIPPRARVLGSEWMHPKTTTALQVALFGVLLTGLLHASTRLRATAPGPVAPVAALRPAARLPRYAPPSADRCAAIESRYRTERAAQAVCARHEDCQVAPREWADTGLDGCFLATNRALSSAPADKLAEAWLAENCLSSFALCPPITMRSLCQEGSCIAAPPEGVSEGWKRLDIEELMSVFVPAEMAEQTIKSLCGHGPRPHVWAAPGLQLRVTVSNDLGAVPFFEEEPVPDRLSLRLAGHLGPYPATWFTFHRANLSRKDMPDGTWPPYELNRSLVIDGVNALPSPFGRSITGPSTAILTLDGAQAAGTVATQILASVVMW